MPTKIYNWYRPSALGVNSDYWDFDFGSKPMYLRTVYFSDTTRKLVSGAIWLFDTSTDSGKAQPAALGQVHGTNGAIWEGKYLAKAPMSARYIFYTTVAGDSLSVKILLEEP